MNQILYIDTQRLELIPCSLEVAQATINRDKPLLEKLLTAYVPDDWYTTEVQDFLPKYIQLLADDASQLGYGVWLMIRTDDSTLVGDLGFGGKLAGEKAVGEEEVLGREVLEIGYEVLSAYRDRGYASEAVEALVNFAFTQLQARKIIAHTPENNIPSIRVAEKVGMKNVGTVKLPDLPGVNVFKWELVK
ncbi:GNAT family N-acetyltransferase [Calothrix sp. UHCC 0171]|uniref:GNAT family N-acetyltransferase n=1 Tax=Calothrix sp. UHCC 0171 TaxID=3110245 RepID=UPI002B20BE5F|nr:GNAT family N-acetyltransferase [Calothrix sp. UHCC 0171]MEA5570371.1 GNAT family N-acetyltransferase [Calothrix sp. UHCC 0171]